LLENGQDLLIRQMCSRGLGEAAIRYIRERKALERDRDELAWWVMREMECHARLALSQRPEAQRRWQTCQEIAEDYRQAATSLGDLDRDARWPWIVWQLARCRLLEAQASLALTLANPANSSERDKALEIVRSILQEMENLQGETQRRQPLAARQGPEGGSQAPPEQLRNLAADAQLLRCEAILVRSQLYPEGSSDRSAALAEVQVLVRDVLDRASQDWTMRPAMLLAQATAQLESGDETALEVMERIATDRSAASNVRLLAGVALARGLVHRNQESRAHSVLEGLESLTRDAPELAPNWMLAKLEIAFLRLKNPNDDHSKATLQALAEQTRNLGELYGDYWRTRAEALMVGRMSSDQVQDAQFAMDLLLAEVRQLTAAGRTEQAIEKLILARDAQSRQGNADAAIELSGMAATLLRHLEKWPEAAAAVEETCIHFRQFEAANEVHLWAIRARAEAVRRQKDDTSIGNAYQQALSDHLLYWPNSNSTQQIAGWLRDWCISYGGRQQYLDVLLELLSRWSESSFIDPQLNSLMEQLLILSESARREQSAKILNSQTSFASQAVKQACQAVAYAALALTEGDGLPHWSSKDAIGERANFLQAWMGPTGNNRLSTSRTVAAAVAMDRLRMEARPPSLSQSDFNQLPLEVRVALCPALVAILDAYSNSERQDIWSRLGLHADWVGEILDSPNPAMGKLLDSNPTHRAALGRIAWLLGDQSHMGELRQLTRRFPKNGTVQLMLAYFHLHQAEIQESTELATRVAAFSQPGSPLHLSARWCLLRAQVQAGQKAEASKAARLLLATQADLDSLWTIRFQQVAQQ